MRISPLKWERVASSSTLRRGAALAPKGRPESPAPAQTPTSPSSSKNSSNGNASTNSMIEAAATPLQCKRRECGRGGVVRCTYITRGAPLTTRLRNLPKSEEAREFNHVQSNLPPESRSSPPANILPRKTSSNSNSHAHRNLKEHLQSSQSVFLLLTKKKKGLPRFRLPYLISLCTSPSPPTRPF